MQFGDIPNPEVGERIDCNFDTAVTSNSWTEVPTITSIESAEDSNLSNLGSGETIVQATGEEDSNNSIGFFQRDRHNEIKNTLDGGEHLPKDRQQDFISDTVTLVSVPKPMKASSISIPELGSETKGLSMAENTAINAPKDNDSKVQESNTAMDQRPKGKNDETVIKERAKPRKVKSLSFHLEPSPTGVEDPAVQFGTPRNEPGGDLHNITPSSCRMRGRASKRANGKSKRSQTPAAPPINLADYGSDDDIAADLVETAYAHSETHARKKPEKPALRNTKPHEACSVSNNNERSARHDNSTQETHAPGQDNAERVSTRARVSFELPDFSNAATRLPKPKCHTPFPRDTVDLLAASDSEDSDGIPLECRAKTSLSISSSKSIESVQTNDSSLMENHRSPQNATPFWMSELKGEARDSSNAHIMYPSKKVSFTQTKVRTCSTKATTSSTSKPAQYTSFVRIGAPRNKLTFERATETLNISPGSPSRQRPKLVPGSYCCTCGQNVSHL